MRTPLLALLALSCTEYGYTSQVNTDVFQQVRRNTVDVLMVVDNSCSMAEEQDKLASNFQDFIGAFEGIDVDWQMAVVTTDMASEDFQGRFLGGDDEVELQTADGRTIDRVSWNAQWGNQEGVAMQLDPGSISSSQNDDQDAWCLATQAFGAGDLGTPGAANSACDGSRAPAGDTGGDTGADTGGGGDTGTAPAEVSSGDVVITEFLADPAAVEDALGEWVELTNTTDAALDLSGLLLVDDGRNSFTIPSGTTIAAGGRLVLGRSTDTAANGGAPVDVATDADMTLNNNALLLTSSSQGAEEIFGEMVSVGTSGSGIEMGLEAAESALSEPLVSTLNEGFLRDIANLSLVFVSDEDDYSGGPVNDYLRFFMDLKGDEAYRETGTVNLSAVVGKDPPEYEGLPSCESSHGLADYGERYVDVSSRTEGAIESICDEDFSPIATELGLTVSGLDVQFELSALPDVSSLDVRLYADQDERSFIAELEQDIDYTYVVEDNAIRFENEQVPASETWVVVEYRVLAEGATVATGGAR